MRSYSGGLYITGILFFLASYFSPTETSSALGPILFFTGVASLLLGTFFLFLSPKKRHIHEEVTLASLQRNRSQGQYQNNPYGQRHPSQQYTTPIKSFGLSPEAEQWIQKNIPTIEALAKGRLIPADPRVLRHLQNKSSSSQESINSQNLKRVSQR